jgi:hypothetical protein
MLRATSQSSSKTITKQLPFCMRRKSSEYIPAKLFHRHPIGQTPQIEVGCLYGSAAATESLSKTTRNQGSEMANYMLLQKIREFVL